MSSSSVNDINDMFGKRLTRPDKQLPGRPVNPFAVTSAHTKTTKFLETLFRPEVSETAKLGAEYQGHIVDTKFEDTVLFDSRYFVDNPKAGMIKFTPNRLKVEHTREK